jgi:hypothetical protein
MGRVVLTTTLMAFIAAALAGCGLADSHAVWPEMLKTKTAEPTLEAPPDARALVRTHLDAVFTAGSAPHDVQVSQARHDLRGAGWTACVRAELTSATGKPLGVQTYRITVSSGVIIDRRRVEADDACPSEGYEPV